MPHLWHVLICAVLFISSLTLLHAGRSGLAGKLCWLWLFASCGFADVPLWIAARSGDELPVLALAVPFGLLVYPAFVLTVPSLLAVARAARPRHRWLALCLGAVVAVGVLVVVSLPGPWAEPRTLAAVIYLALGAAAVFTATVVR